MGVSLIRGSLITNFEWTQYGITYNPTKVIFNLDLTKTNVEDYLHLFQIYLQSYLDKRLTSTFPMFRYIFSLSPPKTQGLSKTHIWGQLPKNYITLNPYNFYSLSRIGKSITAINLACKNQIENGKYMISNKIMKFQFVTPLMPGKSFILHEKYKNLKFKKKALW